MKKVFATILAVLYLSTSMGATLHLHYCMGKLFSWSLNSREDKACEQCGMPKSGPGTDGHGALAKGGCCKDTQTFIKLDKDQKAAESDHPFVPFSFETLAVDYVNLPDRYVSSMVVDHPRSHAPPDPDKVPLFIRNCHFRI